MTEKQPSLEKLVEGYTVRRNFADLIDKNIEIKISRRHYGFYKFHGLNKKQMNAMDTLLHFTGQVTEEQFEKIKNMSKRKKRK